MKALNFKSLIVNKELWFHIIIWTLFFLSINVEWTKTWVADSFLPEAVAPHIAIAVPLIFILNAFWLIPIYLNKKHWHHYISLSLSLFLGFELLRAFIFTSVLHEEVSFIEVFKRELFGENSLIFGFLNLLIFYAIFYSFVYRFTRDWLLHKSIIDRLVIEKQQLQQHSLQLAGETEILQQAYYQHKRDQIVESKPLKKSLSVKKRDGIFLFMIEDIVYFQAQGDFIFAFDKKGRKHIVNESLKRIKDQVCTNVFFQINRSELVNFYYITKFNSYTKNRLEISLNNLEEPLYTSNSRTPEFRLWVDQH